MNKIGNLLIEAFAYSIQTLGEPVLKNTEFKTPSKFMLPPDITLGDIKQIRNYFGEHDATLFEHRAFSILSRIINHLETSGINSKKQNT